MKARLVVANEGSLLPALQAQAAALGLAERVQFVGRLDPAAQSTWYARARWYLSLPRSDSVAVSVLEAMAHGCVPLLSNLPANHELVRSGDNGLIVADGAEHAPASARLELSLLLAPLLQRADEIAAHNRRWIAEHALFAPCVQQYLARLRDLAPASFAP